jgi:hypothetical protein
VDVGETAFSWSLQTPEESAAGLDDPANETPTFTPDVRGLYVPSIDLSVSLRDWPAAELSTSARIVAADDQTDTFERDALESPGFPWRTSGGASWTLSEAGPHSGRFAARSGAIGDQDTTRLFIRLIFQEPGEISFAYRVHSEKETDFLRFSIDGVEQGVWSGDTGWSPAAFAAGAGTHTFVWEYVKGFFGAFGADAAWIDDVFFPTSSVASGAETNRSLPTTVELLQNYPNPFNPATSISYALPSPADVRIEVFDVLGRLTRTLFEGPQSAGWHRVDFDAGDLPSGMYSYRMSSGTFTITRWMVLLR